MDINTPLSKIRGFGPTYLGRLDRLGLKTGRDLLYHFPSRYEDLSATKKIAELSPSEVATVRGQIWEIRNMRGRSGKTVTRAMINDGSGSIEAVWFNQPFLTKLLKSGTSVSLAGKVQVYAGKINLSNPDYELSGAGIHTGRIVPIYPETEGLSSKWLRTKISQTINDSLSSLKEYLPNEILSEHRLLGLKDAILKIHLPKNWSETEAGRRRFGFEEFFLLNLTALIRKSRWQKKSGISMAVDQEKTLGFLASLPFNLTSSQKKVMTEILDDIKRDRPMNRLLQGEVGSGKTVVAAAASYIAYLNGYQAALMAPTEILAEQHYRTLKSILTPLGVSVGLRTGSKKSEVGDVTVGTHALLGQTAEFSRLGLVVIDEQQRFGVQQRAALRGKGKFPHVLTMTATPIPRTLALTLYGDLDLSVIDELPPGRKLVKTYLVPAEKRDRSYQFVREKVSLGQQIFIVTPLIEPSESLSSVKSAKAEFGRLREEVFPDLKLGLLHGRLKSSEKDKVLDRFRDKKLDILVTTPVVEVGIDIQNATIMLIEGAERFGLAQLHQLRGRVGRGSEESWCLLFTEDRSEKVLARLKALEKSHSGQELAELDMSLRGPGEIHGLRQSGIPDLKIANLSDLALLDESRAAAEKYLLANPDLTPPLNDLISPMLEGSISPD